MPTNYSMFIASRHNCFLFLIRKLRATICSIITITQATCISDIARALVGGICVHATIMSAALARNLRGTAVGNKEPKLLVASSWPGIERYGLLSV